MTTAAPSTALATIQPAFTDTERLALAGFLAGFRGLTREAYALDLRQFTSWCRSRSLALFAVRRADIESFARELDRAVMEWTVRRTGALARGAGWYEFDPGTGLMTEIRAYLASPPAAGASRLEFEGFPYAERGYTMDS